MVWYGGSVATRLTAYAMHSQTWQVWDLPPVPRRHQMQISAGYSKVTIRRQAAGEGATPHHRPVMKLLYMKKILTPAPGEVASPHDRPVMNWLYMKELLTRAQDKRHA